MKDYKWILDVMLPILGGAAAILIAIGLNDIFKNKGE
jgi:hypothetical protein